MRRRDDLCAGLRRVAVPVAAYVAITLVLPAANGAWTREGFFRHAGWVLAGCAAAVAVALAVGIAARGARAIVARSFRRSDRQQDLARPSAAGAPEPRPVSGGQS